MVLVKAKRDEILAPLSAVSGIIERRHTLPILSNVLIERVGGNLSFLATDIEIQITAKSGLEAAAESHSITVGARKLLDILRALPDSAEVTLQQQDKRLVVKAGRSRFSLQSLPAEDFPRLAKPAGEAARFKLEQKALRRLLSLVQYAMVGVPQPLGLARVWFFLFGQDARSSSAWRTARATAGAAAPFARA